MLFIRSNFMERSTTIHTWSILFISRLQGRINRLSICRLIVVMAGVDVNLQYKFMWNILEIQSNDHRLYTEHHRLEINGVEVLYIVIMSI